MRPVPPPELPCTFLPDDVWAAIAMSLGLSKREAEIAALIMRDETERAMAGELGMSAHTVHTHLERLYRKLNARSRSQVVVRIFQRYVQLESGRSRGERVLPHRRALGHPWRAPVP